MNQKNKKILIVVGVGVAVLAVFYSGFKYGQASSPAQGLRSGLNFTGGQFGQVGGNQKTTRNFGGMVAGQIINQDDQSLTVKAKDGSSRLVFYNASTTVMKEIVGSITDVQKGSEVSINGKANTDGSVNAQMIQLRPVDLPVR